MPSFSIALSGLEADSTALNTIGNNLANLNTTAYKDQTTTFSDLFYQQMGTTGAGDPILSGVGTMVQGTSTDFSQGTPSTVANNSSDMAISGNGFFLVEQDGQEELTRAGNFSLDSSGNLVTAEGQSVMGYGATGGVVNATGDPTALTIPVGEVQQAQATTTISMDANLDSSSTTDTTFSTSMTIYDSLGVSHNATVTFTNAGSNTWDYSIALPSSDYTGKATNTTGTLTFNSDGTLTSPTSNVSGISFAGLADGASDLTFNWDLYNSSGQPTISTSASASAAPTTNQNGLTSGVYEGFSVDEDGVITAQFDNGGSQVIGQVALANVTNLQGLKQTGDNSYVTTGASGNIAVGTAKTGGLGTIQDDALEDSNVDISTEFANLIVAQRAFEANSKAVTTFDTVTQETINLIH